MTTQQLIERVRAWGADKGITGPNGKATDKTQFKKLMEEVWELYEGIMNDDQDECIDAIGDCAVVLILMANLRGVEFEDCLESAYNVIKSRTGKMVDGAFVKDQ